MIWDGRYVSIQPVTPRKASATVAPATAARADAAVASQPIGAASLVIATVPVGPSLVAVMPSRGSLMRLQRTARRRQP